MVRNIGLVLSIISVLFYILTVLLPEKQQTALYETYWSKINAAAYRLERLKIYFVRSSSAPTIGVGSGSASRSVPAASAPAMA